MIDEYIIVSFSGGSRDVLADDENLGLTDALLTIDTGRHTLALDGPPDYTPASMEVTVKGTSVANPMKVAFAPDPNLSRAMLVGGAGANPLPRRKRPGTSSKRSGRAKLKRKS